MRICIIGCGYVGKAVATQWRQEGHEITVTTRSLKRAYELRRYADFVYILSDDWHELVEKQDVVLLSVAPDQTSDYVETYLRTTENLVRSLSHSCVSQIIYTSSTSIYGEHQGEWVDENTSPQPNHSNAQILLTAEKTLLKAETEQRKVCIFRLGEIYGPDRSITERVKRMQGSAFPGTGENYTNLIHLDEILSALNIALNDKLNGIYNLCNDIHMKRKNLYQQICEMNGWPDVQWNPLITSAYSSNKRVSNQKLKLTGWNSLATKFI